jgi:2-amino-4-hydroxy-6-hydroxymethyldihydropteridine diphosphokinase
MSPPVTAYIGLGTNLGSKQENIRQACNRLGELPDTKITAVSSVIETGPLGPTEQPEFLNAVAETQTGLNPDELLAKLLEIETALGRDRKQKWGPRTIDLDLLLYGEKVVNSEDLTVPHSQMHLRSFVLKGLCELNPDIKHPALGVPVSELAERLNGGDFILKPQQPQLVSIAGLIGVGKTTLATKLSKRLNAELLLEPYDTNPFLPKVYAGKQDLALHSQLYFLLNRVEQLNPVNFIAGQLIFTDYVFEKDLIYARQLLDVDQLSIYERLYPLCPVNVAKPVLVIYLRDTAENCLDRIHHRNRPYEQKIDTQFLCRLDAAYEQLFAQWANCPLIRISKSEFDCTRPDDVDYLITQINAYCACDIAGER